MTTPPPRRAAGRLAISPSVTPRDLEKERALVTAWQARVITLFPEAFPGVLGLSLTGKALRDGIWALTPIDLRTFGLGKHRNVDDTPAGGGAGMVLRADVLGRAIDMAQRGAGPRADWPLVALSPRGVPFRQETAQRWARGRGVTLICGRFEGIDQRVIDHYGIEEISLGDFVLTGGELAAQAMLDATVRLLPDVLGNAASIAEESFASGLLEHPQYTRPADWQGLEIPAVLQSGNHAEIARWRHAAATALTQERRPDLWSAWTRRADKD